jgi:hypothetical protein
MVMRITKRYAPAYSRIYISDASGGTPPDPTIMQPVMSTPTCVSVSVLMDQDGPTTFTLGDFREVIPQRVPQQAPVFDGMIDTPEAHLVISTAESVVFMDMPVRGKTTRVRIWTNHPTEPDEVIIGVE